MGTIKKIQTQVRRLDLRSQMPVLIEQTANEIEELNKAQLYQRGEDSTGTKLDPYRSTIYGEFKHRMNPSPGLGTPDLFLTGAFYRGFFVRVTPTTFGVDSRDSKSSDLKRKYGETIFGLTRASKRDYIQIALWQAVKNYVTSTSGLRFR